MNLPCKLSQFRVRPGSHVNLRKRPTDVEPLSKSKKQYEQFLGEYRAELADLQSVLYAHNRYSVLMVFQGMDTAGKGGAIKHVMSGVNPQGCQVFSFQQPSREELNHDFLWRTNKRLPERGRIGIFDRSYYEEVLIVRVNPKVLQAQQLPEECVHEGIWEERFQDIVQLEQYLHRNGTRIVKFFLHLSREEQRKRFLARIDSPEKNWKLTRADIEVRQQWDAYQQAYAECLSATSSVAAPWYVVPADDKRNARLIVSHILVETMKALRMKYPTASESHRRELLDIRKALEQESPA